jgi:hypothetical protein
MNVVERYKNGENEHKQHSMLSAQLLFCIYVWVYVCWVKSAIDFLFLPPFGIMKKFSFSENEAGERCERERERERVELWVSERKIHLGENEKLTAQRKQRKNESNPLNIIFCFSHIYTAEQSQIHPFCWVFYFQQTGFEAAAWRESELSGNECRILWKSC